MLHAQLLHRGTRRTTAVLSFLIPAIVLVALGVTAGAGTPLAPRDKAVGPQIGKATSLPFSFEPNAGQMESAVKFAARQPAATLMFKQDGLDLTLAQGSKDEEKARSQVKMRFLGAGAAEIDAGSLLPGKVSYMRGNDPSGWHLDLPVYGHITYSDLYPGISARYEGTNGQLKSTFRVEAGADPGAIRWHYPGATSTNVADNGSLEVAVGEARLSESAPVSWQEIDGARVPVSTWYTVNSRSEVGFGVGVYDARFPLYIDPTLTYSSFVGSLDQDYFEDVALDAQGNMIMVGGTDRNDDFHDVWVVKMNREGTALVYSFVVGGTRLERAQSVAVDAAGNAYVTGFATSIDYPVINPLQATNRGSYDLIISKFGPGGAMLYSTYFGGTGLDNGMGISVDPAGNIYVGGTTASTNLPTAQAYQGGNAGLTDAFISKINPAGSALIYSTYLGGYAYDEGNDITADELGNAYITGWTYSNTFPKANAFQPTRAGDKDAFVTKLSPDGQTLVYSTFFGGGADSGFPDDDVAHAIAVDAAGSVHLTGYTNSRKFPLRNAVQPFTRGVEEVFIAKFLPDGSDLVYSTYLGGDAYDQGEAVTVDRLGNTYVTGHTDSNNFPVANAIQPQRAACIDGFVTKLTPDGSALSYSTYLGGTFRGTTTCTDYGLGIAVDGDGTAHISGWTDAGAFPVTGNAYQSSMLGPVDGFISKISDPLPPPTATPTGTPPTRTPTATNSPTITPTPEPCGFARPFFEGFEGGTLGAFTASGTPTNAPGWQAASNSFRTGRYSAYARSHHAPSDVRLTSNSSVEVPAGVTQAALTFWHVYHLERSEGACLDGAVLELSTDGGATWVDAGPHITEGGYVATVATGIYNPLEGRMAWCGENGGYTRVTVNMMPFAGQQVKLRFRQGTDGIIQWAGWWVDDISVGVIAACGSVTPTSTVQATSTPQGTGTATRTVTRTATVGATNTATTPAPTNTPGTPGTPMPTATSCSVRFTDVPSSNTFYPFVSCLSCRGIIGGYPCGGPGEPCNATNDPYFRPNANITRGQIAKIVSESAGFSEPAGEQIFEDVPEASPFFVWINRLSNRGVMGGYLCGVDPAEPCGPENRPYFRPNANATRGQISKIVSEAAGFDEEHTSQTFEDVPTTNTFYIWIERLVSRQIMGGYPCGGPGEPCGAENRPYFRWGNTVTRGQASKIVANTFFPGCEATGR